MFTVLGCDAKCWQIWANVATVLAATSTCIGIFLLIGTLYAARNQLTEMAKARFLTTFLETYKLLELEENWKLRRFIYSLTGSPGKLSDQDQEKFDEFIRHIDTVAYIVQKGFIHPDDFLESYFMILLRLWTKSSAFVAYEREKRKDPYWASRFEWLAQQAESYRATNFPNLIPYVYTRTAEGTVATPQQ